MIRSRSGIIWRRKNLISKLLEEDDEMSLTCTKNTSDSRQSAAKWGRNRKKSSGEKRRTCSKQKQLETGTRKSSLNQLNLEKMCGHHGKRKTCSKQKQLEAGTKNSSLYPLNLEKICGHQGKGKNVLKTETIRDRDKKFFIISIKFGKNMWSLWEGTNVLKTETIRDRDKKFFNTSIQFGKNVIHEMLWNILKM